MPAGFYAKNDHGTMLVDENNPSLSLRLKSTPSVGSTLVNVDVTSAEFPVLATRSAAPSYQDAASWIGGGTTRRFQIRSAHNASAQTIECFVYDRPIASSSTAGLVIRDASGRVTFDALGKYGRVAAVYDGHGTFTGTPGRVYAAIPMAKQSRDHMYPHPEIVPVGDWKRRDYYVTGVVAASGHTIQIGPVLVSRIDYTSVQTPFDDVRGTAKTIIVDVTGY
jgi:hypothetical protein